MSENGRVRDGRVIRSPLGPGVITMPTLLRPGDCKCDWSVTEPGVGLACVSSLRVVNSLCSARHERPGDWKVA
jgi:hypothetical protein